jgi:hypothetical protein
MVWGRARPDVSVDSPPDVLNAKAGHAMRGFHRGRILILLSVTFSALVSSGTASAACLARPLVLLHPGASRSAVKLPAFLRHTLICGMDRGPRGAKGPSGARGGAGARGVAGVRGLRGRTGAIGPAGANGANGVPGASGSAGTNGTNGTNGSPGARGTDGSPGADGHVGPMGPAASNTYGYIYDTSGATVAPNTNILFNADGPTTAGITHTPGSSQIVLMAAGTYKVSFSVSADVINEISVFVNGAGLPGGTFASGGSSRVNIGHTILVAAAGDVLTIRNLHPGAGIVLDNIEDGSVLTDASVLIERLG